MTPKSNPEEELTDAELLAIRSEFLLKEARAIAREQRLKSVGFRNSIDEEEGA